jgi:antitoxin component YwqK of YwqJK toxin-antitoxin module
MKHFLIVLWAFLSVLSIQAQEIKISDIEMINLGDGRLFAREWKDEKAALNGRLRLITGYTTEYVDAGFTDGYADGKWTYYKDNKKSEEMTYDKGYLDGELIRYYPDGTIREKSTLKQGKVNGTYTRYSSNNKVESEKSMKEGVEDGPERSYDETGKLVSETIYKDGKPEGKSFTHYNRGSSDAYKRTAFYKNGLLEGEYSEIYDNGAVKLKGKYINGKKDGVWESNKQDGSHRPTETFKNGEVIKRITYFTDGKVEMERNFDENGKQHGVEKKYDWEDGSLKTELNYVHGKQVGKQVRYMSSNAGNFIETSNFNEAGQKDGDYSEIFVEKKNIKAKGQYVKDKKNGKWTYGYENGFLYKEEIYDNGKLIDTKKLQ